MNSNYKEIGANNTTEATNSGNEIMNSFMQVLQQIQSTLVSLWMNVSIYLPDVSKVYLEPLLPTPQRSLSERYHLIIESCRPWSQFFNLSEYNLPPFSQMKSRLEHNIEVYFYNYLIITFIHIVIFALFHLFPVITLTLYIVLLYILFIQYPDDIDIGGYITLDNMRKKILAAFIGLLVIFFGGFFTLFFSVVIFYTVLVVVHGLIRDDNDYVVIESSA